MDKRQAVKGVRQAIQAVREKNPLAPSLTNTVTVNFVANAQIAVGGSAAMFYYGDEALALAEIANAFYMNLGTFLPVYEETIPMFIKGLADRQCPWVLDPVSLEVGAIRKKMVSLIKEYPPKLIRGNPSEIISLAKTWELTEETSESSTRGVDSTDEVDAAKASALSLAKFIDGAVAVSGEVDLITDGQLVAYARGGSHFMEKITGAGCALGGVCAIYLCESSPFIAALTASMVFNQAGNMAQKIAKGPASYQMAFLDALYQLKPEDILEEDLILEE